MAAVKYLLIFSLTPFFLFSTTSCGKVINGIAQRSAARGVRSYNRQQKNEDQSRQEVKTINEDFENDSDDFGSSADDFGGSANTPTFTSSNNRLTSRISTQYAVQLSDQGLWDFEVTHLDIPKQKITLHYSHAGKSFTTHWVHDYLVKRGKYCFAVESEDGKISGLLQVSKIDKSKSGSEFQKAGDFARKVKKTVRDRAQHDANPF